MEEVLEARRQKWLVSQQRKGGSDPPTSNVSASAPPPAGGGDLADGGTSVAASSSASAAAPPQFVGAVGNGGVQHTRRVHILPVGSDPTGGGNGRLDWLAPEMRRKREARELIKNGLFINAGSHEFIVVKVEPDESVLGPETDYYVDGEPIKRLQKIQFMCLWDYESGRGEDAASSSLFSDYISPYFRQFTDGREARAFIVNIGETLPIRDLNFQVMKAEPDVDIGIVDQNTLVYVDWDGTPEFDRIHIVPFQDTLPHAYQFDVFNDYLKPYLTRNKHMRFHQNYQFTYQGVQFKVVCCEPPGPARIGRNTTIFCEGVLHPDLRNLLPPEILEQLSALPPGLQMLLLNTEALAGGYEERLMEVQEMLSRRRGLNPETIQRLDRYRWGERQHAEDAQVTCMVCLGDFGATEEVTQLPCNHLFHSSCIDEWLRRCADCPICKANVERELRHR